MSPSFFLAPLLILAAPPARGDAARRAEAAFDAGDYYAAAEAAAEAYVVEGAYAGDTPDKQDSTQYKRAAIVGLGALAVIATGGQDMAARVTTENLGRGTERIGDSERKGVNYLADARSADALHAAWRDARVTIRHQADVEKGVIRSSAVLYPDPAAAPARLASIESAIDKKTAALLEEARALYALHAQRLNTAPVFDPPMTPQEEEAANLVVDCAGTSTLSGCASAQGGRGQGGGGRGRGATPGPSLPQHMTAEFAILLGKKKTALEIRDFLTGEFEPVSLDQVMAVLRARQTAGTIQLVARPAEPAPRKKKG